MFQDSTGTTPVTAVEQPVGLLLDKSKGGRQSLAVTGWAKNSGDGTVTVDGNTITITGATTTTRVDIVAPGWAVGDYADMTVTGFVAGATGQFVFLGGASAYSTLSGTNTFRNVIASSTLLRLQINTGSATFVVTSRGYVPGNHASQSTAASRPVLSARVNLLTYSEQFDNAAWIKGGILAFGSGSVANATAAPDSTITADLITENTANDGHGVSQSPSAASLVAYTSTAYFKRANGTRNAYIQINNNVSGTGGAVFASYDLTGAGAASAVSVLVAGFTSTSAAITPLSDGWYRCTLSLTTVATTTSLGVYCSIFNAARVYTGDGTSGLYIWGADLRVTNDGVGLPAYQRVGAATYGTSTVAGNPDYDTTGFPFFLAFNGSTGSRWMVSSTITPGTDKAQVFAGVRKLSDAAAGIVVELSTSAANNGSFGLQAPNSSTNSYRYETRGTNGPSIDSTGYAAPITNVLTGLGDISAPSAFLRINGAQSASSSVSQGTGNFLAYPLYIGARAGTSLYYDGNLYELIVRFGPNLSEATIDQTEVWVGDKTGLNLSFATQQTIFDRFNATVLDRLSDIILQRY
jgi:hypothetical protein